MGHSGPSYFSKQMLKLFGMDVEATGVYAGETPIPRVPGIFWPVIAGWTARSTQRFLS